MNIFHYLLVITQYHYILNMHIAYIKLLKITVLFMSTVFHMMIIYGNSSYHNNVVIEIWESIKQKK